MLSYEHIKAIDVDSAEIVSFAQISFHDFLLFAVQGGSDKFRILILFF
jgi:hypothetical protein